MILVGAALKGRADGLEVSLAELARLVETAGGVVAGTVFQRVERWNPATLIGAGKVEEVAAAARRERARTIVFDDELSPAQQKALEAATQAKIIDRTRLILDIFARRARTKEGELQVELAQLSYLLPRLTGAWRGFSQQVGGIGTRGPGERKLEYERRHISRRIEYLKRGITRMEREREVQRRRRRSVPVPQIALLGYTNVGKSTLLNALTREDAVYADDKLFATLDPTTRRVRLPRGGWAVFTDTVGFIQKLPTALVAAFRSTLEEAKLADCLVHVIDASAPDWHRQRAAVEEVLKDLGIADLPRVEVLNKADLAHPARLHELGMLVPGALPLSARRKSGMTALLTRIEEVLGRRWVLREVVLDAARAGLAQEAYRSAQVLDEAWEGGRLRLRLRVTPENWARLTRRFKPAAAI